MPRQIGSRRNMSRLPKQVTGPLGAAVVASGVLGVFCSVMVYQCTRRDLWNGFGTTSRFLFTSIGLGLATALVTSLAAGRLRHRRNRARSWRAMAERFARR